MPEPPAGEVTVTGWVRADGSGEQHRGPRPVHPGDLQRARSGEALDREVYGGFVELRSEDPEPAEPLEPVELPELDNGPHFFYGLQWWFFGVLASSASATSPTTSGGTGRAARAGQGVARRPEPGQSARSMPPSTGSIAPDTNDAAGESKKAAARPNSSGSP